MRRKSPAPRRTNPGAGSGDAGGKPHFLLLKLPLPFEAAVAGEPGQQHGSGLFILRPNESQLQKEAAHGVLRILNFPRLRRNTRLFPRRVVKRIEQMGAGHKLLLFRLAVVQVKSKVSVIFGVLESAHAEGRHDQAPLGGKQFIHIILDPPVKIMCGHRYDVPLLLQSFLCSFFLFQPESGIRQLFQQQPMIHAFWDFQHAVLVQQAASRLKAECRSAQIAHFCIHRFAQRVGQSFAFSVFQHELDFHVEYLLNM